MEGVDARKSPTDNRNASVQKNRLSDLLSRFYGPLKATTRIRPMRWTLAVMCHLPVYRKAYARQTRLC